MRYSLLQKYYESSEWLNFVVQRGVEMQKMDGDPVYRMQRIQDLYSKDPIAFIMQFGVLKIPEFDSAIKPFKLFDYQREIITRLYDAEDDTFKDHEILIDKVREMGLTWTVIWYHLWRWLFTKGWSGFVMSRTEDEVDDGTDIPDNTIFGKYRFGLKKIPRWLLPPGFIPKYKKGTSTDTTLRLVNPNLGSSLNGSTTNAFAGRSRRYNMVFVDEAFYVENFGRVYASLQTVARTKVFVSTSRAGYAYKKLQELCIRKRDYVTLPYEKNPFKDKVWYEEEMEKAEVDDEVMKEIEISYAVNPKVQYYPEVSKASVQPLRYDSKLPLYLGLDVGKNDLTVIPYFQYDGDHIRILECYFNKLRPMEWYIPFMNWTLFYASQGNPMPGKTINEGQYNPEQLKFINKICTWQKPKGYFGEVAHTQRSMPLNVSVRDILFKQGQIHLTVNEKAATYEPRRRATSLLLPKMIFNSESDRVMRMYDAIINSRYANAAKSTSKTASITPVHDDEISDFRSSLENFCVNFHRTLRAAQHDPNTQKSNEHVSQYRNLVNYLGR